MPLLAFAAIAAVLAVPAASAQLGIQVAAGAPTDTLVEDKYAVVPYAGNFTVPVTVQVGCGTLLLHADQPKVSVSIDPMPTWLAASIATFDFTPSQETSQCATGNAGYVNQTKPLAIALKPDAPGIVLQNLNIKAKMASGVPPAGGSESLDDNVTVPIQVQFHPAYTITPDVRFPLAVKCKAAFEVAIANSSNAPSMVMIESTRATTGLLSGLGPTAFDPPAAGGTDTKVFNVTYTPPAQWTSATVTFTAYAHFLINPGYGAGEFRAPQNVTWEFTNAGCPSTTTTSATAKSPLPTLPVILALAGVAVIMRRSTAKDS